MEKLTQSELLLRNDADPRSQGWLTDNVWHPFVNGTGVRQLYNNFAEEKIEPAYVAANETFTPAWMTQALAQASGAVLMYAAAGKLTGCALSPLSKTMAFENTARFLASEHTAQILGAGLFDLAKAPDPGETRLGNAAGSMAAFGVFAGGNHWLGGAKNSWVAGIGRIGTGAAGGLVGLESSHSVSSMQGSGRQLSWDDRFAAMTHGGFINFALPAVQKAFSETIRTKAGTDAAEPRLDQSRHSSITEVTDAFEKWMGNQTKLVPQDLAAKHIEMAKDPLSFLRGTYYRWAERFPQLCPELQDATKVNSVGDMHVNNFGTWINRLRRSVWGVNDFDEAARLPYTNDLVRLVTSARLPKAEGLKLDMKETAEAVLDGYRQGLKDGGSAFLLDQHPQLAKIAADQMPEPSKFWHKLKEQLVPVPASSLPPDAIAALNSIMPPNISLEFGQRRAGVGSLGRQRYVAIGTHEGVMLASEVKALLPPASDFAEGKATGSSNYDQILRQSVRESDPDLGVKDHWVVRRLAPDRSKIELADLKHAKDEKLLLYSMGYEIANIHLGSRDAAPAILSDLKVRDKSWLADAARKMKESTNEDYQSWKLGRQ